MECIHACIRSTVERAGGDARTSECRALRAALIATATVLLMCSFGWGQSGIQGLSTLPSAEQVINRNQDPYAGSIPQGKATSAIRGGRKWDAHVTSIGGATGAKYSLLPPENATGNYVKVVQRIPIRIDFDGNDKPDFNKDGLLAPRHVS